MAKNAFETRTSYVITNNPDTVNESTPYMDGQVGQVLNLGEKTYQYVQVDSGATASNTVGVVAANEVAFWKDQTRYIVTNDLRQAVGGRNAIAGIFRNAMTAGYYGFLLQQGDAISVKSDASGAAGDLAVANSGTNADVTAITAGTAPTYRTLGTIRAAAAGGNISVDLNIPQAP